MYNRTCPRAVRINCLKSLMFFLMTLTIAMVLFPSSSIAGLPLEGEVYVYNVGPGNFCVAWLVDTPSTCYLKVYEDIGGNTEVTAASLPGFTVTPITDTSTVASDRGLMQVTVTGLSANEGETFTYYIQTVSTDASDTYYYPSLGNLIEVITEPVILTPGPNNGWMELFLYGFDGIDPNPANFLVNLEQEGVVAFVDAGGNSPVASDNNGLPELKTIGPTSFHAVEINFGKLRSGYAATNYFDWQTSPQDHAITITCLGGGVEDVGYGKKIIQTTFPSSLIPAGTEKVLGCVSGVDGCIAGNTRNQIVFVKNQGPDFNLNPDQTANKNQPFTISNICATDPEGHTVAGFSLSDQPSGMDIVTDANCFTITWTPTVCGTFENIKVAATDDQGGSTTKTFTVDIKRCPPYQPGASIQPQSPVTTQDLICTGFSNGDPDGDPIYFRYEWYNVANPSTILSNDSTLNSIDTAKDNDYECKVIAWDTDGDSEPFIAGPVTVLNSPPDAPLQADVEVTPMEPTADDDLVCTVKTPPDDDDGDTVQYIYQWKCTSCGDKPVDPNGTSDTLSHTNTARGETWFCEVIATDGTDQSSSVQSYNTANIANQPPSDPGGIHITPVSGAKTVDALTCTIDANSNDLDGDTIEYVFTWKCDGDACGTQASIERAPTEDRFDTLTDTNTAKDQTWSCEVWAQDEYDGKSNTIAAVNSVIIENSLPENLSVELTPVTAYKNDTLTCKASGVTDADGDTISYKYEWKKDGAIVATTDFTENNLEDILEAVNTSQGEAWSCEVTARDTSNAEIGRISDPNEVVIGNRDPVIITTPDFETHIWDEEGSYTIQIDANDPDGNELTLLYDDANSVDLNDLNVSAWLTFDSVNNILSADPPFGSSSLNLGYGEGVLKFNFIVEETDGTPIKRVEKSVTAKIRFPAIVVDDFEYDASASTLAENGWFELQGSGDMLLKQEVSNDPNSNHYLKTTVTGTPTNNSQLNYIIYKTIPTGSEYNNVYPKILFSVNDKNLYYFDAFVRAKNNAGEEKNFFLRYIPQDPNAVGWESKVSGSYVRYNIGEESLDPNGTGIITEVERNMDQDLFNATKATGGFHYLYLKGIVLRGDIDFIDDIKVRSAPPAGFPKDVVNLDAMESENQVILTWDLPENQVENIAGYNIYMDTNDDPAKEEAFKIATVGPDKTSYTETGLENGVTYCFRVTAKDNLLPPNENETEGVTDCATPQKTEPLDPIDLKATSIDSTIELTWRNPPDQHPDLAGYIIHFTDCNSCYAAPLVTPDKADPNGRFIQYITKDENQEYLKYDHTYSFTVKAKDTALEANFSNGESVPITLEYPATKLIDNLDIGYESGETLSQRGWYRLQGTGQFKRKAGVGKNNYLEVKSSYTGPSALNYKVVKWLKNPTEFTNPNFKARVRSLGDFEIVLYVKGEDGNYFLSYKADATDPNDSTNPVEVRNRWHSYTLGWANKASSTEWFDIKRNLKDDLFDANGIEFNMLLGIILQGTLDIDNMELGEGIPEAENLTARPGETSVLLSWTTADPNKIVETEIYVDTNLRHTITVSLDKDYQYNVEGLDTNKSYEFKIVQVTEEDKSNGVSVSATTMAYKTVFTFDDQAALDEWSLTISDGVGFDVVYDSGVQSNVMYLNPEGPNPDRGYYAYKGMDISDVTGMTCNIKTSSNFSIWLSLENPLVPAGLPFMLGVVPGGTAGTYTHYYSPFGDIAYYFLGPGYTDGNWHYLDLNLDEIMGVIIGSGIEKVEGIYFGGRIYVDDVSIY